MWKVNFPCASWIFLTLLNLRGVKESCCSGCRCSLCSWLTYTVADCLWHPSHAGELPGIANGVASSMCRSATASQIGWWAMLVVILRAYSLGQALTPASKAVRQRLERAA